MIEYIKDRNQDKLEGNKRKLNFHIKVKKSYY